MEQTASCTSHSTGESGAVHAKNTILVVDDDPSILRVITRVFERAGYNVTTVATGKDALRQIEHNCFNAALIDVRLPDMLGTDLLSKLSERSPKAVKIVFTGSPEPEYRQDAEKKHADAFFTKPVNPATLLMVLDEKLKTKTQNND